jgi:hemolysin III
MSDYSPREEKLNIITHAFGLIFSIVALMLLLIKTAEIGNFWSVVAVSIFGVSLVVLYAASTLYHSATQKDIRFKMKIFDHSAIYILIAGTYTPFTIITLNGTTGWLIFGISWGMALVGIILKLFFTGRYNAISTLMYILMGWMIVFVLGPIIDGLHFDGVLWLIGGGVSYTIGAIIYSIKKIKFNHAIFHIFVLVGSFCHFYSVYFYVLSS